MSLPNTNADILIIGGGMAGLTAARTLAEAGRRVLVLEARNRIGGRILTQRIGDDVIELGAEFIHGRPPELWSLIEEAGLTTFERTGDFLTFQDGHLAPMFEQHEDKEEKEQEDATFAPLEALKTYTGPDLSFTAYLEHSNVPPEDRASAIGYVEGFNAADATHASALALGTQQRAEDAIEGDRSWRIHEGYDRLPEYLAERVRAAGGQIHSNTPVTELHWSADEVAAHTPTGICRASRAIIAVPLSVLQTNALPIIPAPIRILEAAARLRMGSAFRMTLLFRTAFWQSRPELANLSFLMTRSSIPSVWWTAHPTGSPTLTGWAGGPRARALFDLTPEDLASHAIVILAEALHFPADHIRQQLLSVHTHDWQDDPHSLGAYTWLPIGALEVPAVLTHPIAHTLFFAGEHTDTTGLWGTVHAALRSGLRAAAQVLEHP